MILEALASHGEVDLLYAGEVAGWSADVPPDRPVRSVHELPIRRIRPDLPRRLWWLLWPAIPIQVMEWEKCGLAGVSNEYDLVWYFRAITHGLVSGVRARWRVVDLDDLEDAKLRQKYAVLGTGGPIGRRLAQRRNAVAWRKYQRRVAEHVDAVTVSNEADRAAFGSPKCHWVPNGFPTVPKAKRTDALCGLLLVGQFEYEPNADAAEYFVRQIFPKIRMAEPSATIRLVGRATSRIHRLAGDGVEVVGQVDDLTPEYDRAAVAVSPVRFGSGTRIKIIEAFARGVPVVSTSVGAAGLGAEHGRHLLLADDADAFAASCVSLIRDPVTARHLSERAADFYERHFGQAAVTAAVARVLARIGSDTPAVRHEPNT